MARNKTVDADKTDVADVADDTAGSLDLRSEDARAKYDASVLEAVRKIGGQVTSAQVLAEVGGSAPQVRRAFQRHITAGSMAATDGATRSKRYYLVDAE